MGKFTKTSENLDLPDLIGQVSFDLAIIVRQFTEKNNSAEIRRTSAAHLKEFSAFAKISSGSPLISLCFQLFSRVRELKTLNKSLYFIFAGV